MQRPSYSASSFRKLTKAEKVRALKRISDHEALAILHDWSFWARDDQITPAHAWNYWLVLAGRGYGKTRIGGEWVRQQVKHHEYVNLIGATSDDARDIMIEGESGIMAICHPDERPVYLGHKRRLDWPNGAKSLIFTADEPDRLRGKQHEKIWADELCAWRYPDSWDQAVLGLRLGSNPQAVITTTPRPTKLLKELVADPHTAITKGSTYDNRENLSSKFIDKIIGKYEGTRLGRQELYAEILDDNPNALWRRSVIDRYRVKAVNEDLIRVVVAIDPAVTSNENSCETGIIVCGRGRSGHGYVLGDYTIIDKPDQWIEEAVRAFDLHEADRIVAEVNNGGDLIESLLRTVNKRVPYKSVRASRGKAIRAEPIAALYEQGKIHHVGTFGPLEDQLCEWNPSEDATSPDRLDALVWGLSSLFESSNEKPVVAGARKFSNTLSLPRHLR